VTLHAKDESFARRLESFNEDAARRIRKGGGTKSSGESLWRHRLVVIAVHGERRAYATEDLGEARPLLHVEWVRQCRSRWICGANLSLHMLQQAATAMNIQQLHPAADAKDWESTCVCCGDRLPLQRVASHIHLDRAIDRFTVSIWMHIGTAGEEETLHAGEGGGPLRSRRCCGDEDRQTTGAADPIGIARVYQRNASRIKICVVIRNGDEDQRCAHVGYARAAAGAAAAS
jgi:hypothetical protein